MFKPKFIYWLLLLCVYCLWIVSHLKNMVADVNWVAGAGLPCFRPSATWRGSIPTWSGIKYPTQSFKWTHCRVDLLFCSALQSALEFFLQLRFPNVLNTFPSVCSTIRKLWLPCTLTCPSVSLISYGRYVTNNWCTSLALPQLKFRHVKEYMYHSLMVMPEIDQQMHMI